MNGVIKGTVFCNALDKYHLKSRSFRQFLMSRFFMLLFCKAWLPSTNTKHHASCLWRMFQIQSYYSTFTNILITRIVTFFRNKNELYLSSVMHLHCLQIFVHSVMHVHYLQVVVHSLMHVHYLQVVGHSLMHVHYLQILSTL